MKRISIFVTLVALIAGMTGCFTPFRMQYRLTISSTGGGDVTTPGEGIFVYWQGMTVPLAAEADEGYYFVNWTGDPCTCNIANINATSTTITMNNDYSITANFAPVIEIQNWYDLNTIRNNLRGHYILINDLDSTTVGYAELASKTANAGKGWRSIGDSTGEFTGTFDGQGYDIRDLVVDRGDEDTMGLFGSIGVGGVIKNVNIMDANVNGLWDVGILAGSSVGTVSGSYSSGNVTGNWSVGGLVGFNHGTVSDSSASGTVSGLGRVGGLAGENTGIVSNSYAKGNVTGLGFVGGLVGRDYGTVSNSYSTGSVSGEEDLGGLVGLNNGGAVSNSFWDTETSGQVTSDGGTGKTTAEMHDITTFSGASWNITAVANLSTRNSSYIWNIVDNVTYPFLSWEPV